MGFFVAHSSTLSANRRERLQQAEFLNAFSMSDAFTLWDGSELVSVLAVGKTGFIRKAWVDAERAAAFLEKYERGPIEEIMVHAVNEYRLHELYYQRLAMHTHRMVSEGLEHLEASKVPLLRLVFCILPSDFEKRFKPLIGNKEE